MFKQRIYLDYASLTPVDSDVIKVIKKYSSINYANPASLYKEGIMSKNILLDSRKTIANFVHAHPDEIIFTSGGTEANNLAIQGTIKSAIKSGIIKPHIIVSNIEHSSIIELVNNIVANDIGKTNTEAGTGIENSIEITRLSVDKFGAISVDELKKSIKPNTVLVSIMTINNELGTGQPINEIIKTIRHYRKENKSNIANTNYPLFHTDTAQAGLYENLSFIKNGVDLASFDGSKMYGPRGIGFLFVKRNTSIQPLIYGGGQEYGLRSGTENIPGCAGLAKATQIADKLRNKEYERLSRMRDYFIIKLKSISGEIIINGHLKNISNNIDEISMQSPHIVNISIPGIDNEFFILQLDSAGIACSTKSSCLHDSDESYVIKAIGGNSDTSIRFSFGRETKGRDIDKTIRIIEKLTKK